MADRKRPPSGGANSSRFEKWDSFCSFSFCGWHVGRSVNNRIGICLAIVCFALAIFGITWTPYAQAACGGNPLTCDTEGEAYLGAKAECASDAGGNTYQGYGYSVQHAYGTADNWACAQGSFGPFSNPNGVFYFNTSCADGPTEINNFFDGPAPASICDGGCNYSIGSCGSSVEVCLPESGRCLAQYCPSGGTCNPDEEPNTPDGCSLVNGTVVCDCTANPSAPFCPGGGDDGSECGDNGDGTVTCDPGNPPEQPSTGDPNSPGGPGDGSGSGQGPGPGDGSSCTAGDPNCYNTGGGICQSGEECYTDDDGSSSNEDPGTCDPASGQCDPGSGSAGTSGSCETQPSCSGDAIQCAILIQSWKNTCNALDLKGEKPPWEADPDYGRDLADEAQEIDVSGQIDAGGFAAASCPANPTLSMFGQTVVIDLSYVCDIAGIVRFFVIILTLMWAGPYIMRSF